MSLQKGFLKPVFSLQSLSRKRFWSGILLGIGNAVVLYFFFKIGRGLLRLIISNFDTYILGSSIILLSESELLFFNFFFAFLGLIWGQSVCTSIWGRRFHKKSRTYGEIILQTQSLFWSYIGLLIAASASCSLQLLPYMRSIEGGMGIYQNFYFPILLSLLMLFLFSWQKLRQIFRISFRRILQVLGVYTLISLCWTSLEEGKYEEMIDNHYQSTPLNHYQIRLPQSVFYEKLSVKQRYTYIHIGYPKTAIVSSKEPSVIVHENEGISFSEFLQNIHKVVYIDFHGWNSIPCLLIDREVPMEYVKKIQMELRRINKFRVIYGVDRKMSWHNIPLGIYGFLPPLSEEEYKSSLVKYPKQTPNTFIPPPPLPPLPDLSNEPTLQLKINDFNQIVVNEKELSLEDCRNLTQDFLANHPQKGILMLEASNQASYNQYIHLLAAIRQIYQRNRNQAALKNYGKSYDHLEKEAQRIIRELHPLNLREVW